MNDRPVKENATHWQHYGCVLSILFLMILYYSETHSMINKNEFGADYLAFWSAGRVADHYGYSHIYTPELLKSLQQEVLHAEGYDVKEFSYWPTAYLPVFVIPFQFISRIDLITSHWAWILSGWVLFSAYLIFFMRKVSSLTRRNASFVLTSLAVILSFPTFSNFIWASMEVFIVICAGEFVRNSIKKRGFMAGLWLGAFIIKPQLLILILLALLILKNMDVIKGALTSGVTLSLVSFLLSGSQGIKEMIILWMGSVPRMATNAPDYMMNWRMLGIRLQAVLPDSLSWGIAIAGIVWMLVICCLMIKPRPVFGSTRWIMTMMGIFAATCAITWHSHIHMAMILIPFYIFGIASKCLSARLLNGWVLFPPALLMLLFLLDLFGLTNAIPLIRNSNYYMALIYLYLNIEVCIAASTIASDGDACRPTRSKE